MRGGDVNKGGGEILEAIEGWVEEMEEEEKDVKFKRVSLCHSSLNRW